MAWSNWIKVGNKSYMFETTLGEIFRNDTMMEIPLNQAIAFEHNLHLSNPEDYICVMEMEGLFTIRSLHKSVSYTISKRLVGINTGNFIIGGHAQVNSEKTVDLLLTWNISVYSKNIAFSFIPINDTVDLFSIGTKASFSKVKIYLFKP